MIVYDTKNWANTLIKIYLSFNRAYTTRILFKYLLYLSLYATAVVVIDIEFFSNSLKINPLFFSLLGVILSLMLVFRLNSAYNKWWEGRKAWGALINHSRTLSANLNALIPKREQSKRQHFASLIANFAMTLQGHLREQIDYTQYETMHEESSERLRRAGHKPQCIATMLFEAVEKEVKAGSFSEIDKLNLKPQIEAMINVLGICERIKNTPIPFSHNTYIKTFILIYTLSLPFGVISTLAYYTIPTVALVAYALLGVEVISEEIEEPFGREANDLPLIHLSNVIKESVYETLGAEKTREIQSVEIDNSLIQIIY